MAPPWRFDRPRLLGAVLLHLIAAPAAAQLAPVPSHKPSDSRPAGSAIVAHVNGVPIRAVELDAALNTVIPLSSYHQNVKPEKLAELRTQALDGLVDEELRYQEAVRLKIDVPPAAVDQALARARKAYPDRESFERARRASGATMPQLRASIKRALMIQNAYERVVVPACTVSEVDAAAYYRKNPGRFVLPEQLRASLITVAVDPAAAAAEWKRARQKADAVARQIASGASFDALAREHSTDPSQTNGGDLGFVHRGQLIDAFEQALSALHPGEVSPVVQTIYGFHLLRLVALRAPVQKTLAEVQATIVRDLTETRCREASLAWSKRLRAGARVQIVDRRVPRRRTTG